MARHCTWGLVVALLQVGVGSIALGGLEQLPEMGSAKVHRWGLMSPVIAYVIMD